jgi:hypothetical protein
VRSKEVNPDSIPEARGSELTTGRCIEDGCGAAETGEVSPLRERISWVNPSLGGAV